MENSRRLGALDTAGHESSVSLAVSPVAEHGPGFAMLSVDYPTLTAYEQMVGAFRRYVVPHRLALLEEQVPHLRRLVQTARADQVKLISLGSFWVTLDRLSDSLGLVIVSNRDLQPESPRRRRSEGREWSTAAFVPARDLDPFVKAYCRCGFYLIRFTLGGAPQDRRVYVKGHLGPLGGGR